MLGSLSFQEDNKVLMNLSVWDFFLNFVKLGHPLISYRTVITHSTLTIRYTMKCGVGVQRRQFHHVGVGASSALPSIAF